MKTTTSPHHVCTRIHHEMQHRTTTAQQEKLELTRQHVSIPKIYSRKPGTRTAYVVQQYEYNMPVLLLLRQLFHSCYQCEQLQQYILSQKKKKHLISSVSHRSQLFLRQLRGRASLHRHGQGRRCFSSPRASSGGRGGNRSCMFGPYPY